MHSGEINKKALIISGVKPSDNEDLVEVATKVGKALACPLSANDIDDIWRFGRQKEKLKIVFLRSITKTALLKKLRERKNLSTKELGLPYDQQVYLNEDLGAGAAQIWHQARQLVKKKIIWRVWTTGGRVFYKEAKEGTAKLFHSLDDLRKLEAGPLVAAVESESEFEAEAASASALTARVAPSPPLLRPPKLRKGQNGK